MNTSINDEIREIYELRRKTLEGYISERNTAIAKVQRKSEEEKKALKEKAEEEKKALTEKAEAEKKALAEKAEAEKKALTEKAEAEKKALTEKAHQEKIDNAKKMLSDGLNIDVVVKYSGLTAAEIEELTKELSR